ncbi:MAG: SpoIIE family protein phosphatase [Phycisphaerae bacterium]|nr:SpoIIE family protein phosphatase [Phycisphaerae bacterium]
MSIVTEDIATRTAAPVHRSHASATVLLVDDQAIVAMAVGKALLGLPDLTLHYCADPAKAIEMAVVVRPTVILQDLVMPGVDGLDLVRRYREREETREIPIIVLSSREEAATKADAFAAGANDYIVKVPDPVELVARVRHHSRGYVAQLERNEAFRRLAASEAHMAQELSQAAKYVSTLLDPPIDRPELRTSWVFIPSASLGGDSFGYHWIDADRFAFYIIDVCGHGVGPALLSVSALSLVRSMNVDDACNPKAVLTRLNANFPMSRHNGMFFTMWYGVYDRRDRSLVYAGAGHPPTLVSTGASLRQLDSDGMMIGVLPEYEVENGTTTLEAGDRIYLYSDGVFEIERSNGKIWGHEAFVEAMSAATNVSRIDHIRRVTQAIRGGDQYADDYSIVEIELR